MGYRRESVRRGFLYPRRAIGPTPNSMQSVGEIPMSAALNFAAADESPALYKVFKQALEVPVEGVSHLISQMMKEADTGILWVPCDVDHLKTDGAS